MIERPSIFVTTLNLSPLVQLILDNAEAVRLGALSVGVREQDVPDIVQDVLARAWLRAERGDFVALHDDPDIVRRKVCSYLYTVGRHWGLYRKRVQRRAVLVANIPEAAKTMDPEPRLLARSELRARAKSAPLRVAAEVFRPGDSLFALLDHIYGPDVPEGTTYDRIRRLRRARTK